MQNLGKMGQEEMGRPMASSSPKYWPPLIFGVGSFESRCGNPRLNGRRKVIGRRSRMARLGDRFLLRGRTAGGQNNYHREKALGPK
jgi:hypothetical protein